MEDKNILANENNERFCLFCGTKMIKRENETEQTFKSRKYCATICSINKNKEKYRIRNPKKDAITEHDKKLVIANEIIGGEITSNQRSKYGPNPDIVNGNSIYELELYGHHTVKNKTRWYKESSKERVLIISIRDDLKKLFDKVYVLEENIQPLIIIKTQKVLSV